MSDTTALSSPGPTTEGDDLAATVHRSCPWAYVVSQRVLRRVVRFDAEERSAVVGSFRLDSFTVESRVLRRIVEPDELGGETPADGPDAVVLIRETDSGWLWSPDPARELERCRRALFRERVIVRLGERGVREAMRWMNLVGRAEFAEATAVLDREGRLRRPDQPWSCCADFIATFLELRVFEPLLVPVFFPSIDDLDVVDERLRELVSPESVLEETSLPSPPQAERLPPPMPLVKEETRIPAKRLDRRIRRARRMVQRGDWARGVLLATRLSEGESRSRSRAQESALDEIVDAFAARLSETLDHEADWRGLLRRLPTGERGFWSPTARLLYDLQRACEERERTAYSIRPVDWLLSLGRRPLWRPLPQWSFTSPLQHLRRAARRLPSCLVSREDRGELESIFDGAIARGEHRLRVACRPEVCAAFENGGVRPDDALERVAYDRLVEEYLDLIVGHGFASLQSLRDTMARNDVKLPDVHGVRNALFDDPLLRTDAELAHRLEGLHRGGEIYLRWLQTLGGLAFGTRVGRGLLLHLVIPFGGSLVVLEGLQHLTIEPLGMLFEGLHHVHLATPVVVVALGCLLHLLIHRPALRRSLGRLVRSAVATVWSLPRTALRWLRRTPALVRRIVWWIVKPALVVFALGAALQAVELLPEYSWGELLVAYFVVNIVVNSRRARDVEEVLSQELFESWQSLLTGIVETGRLVLEFFRTVVDGLERLLYAIDEALRSHEGERWPTAVAKVVLGPIWSAIAYVLRFVVNLLVEPQINPIKHFPVVTVSHKLLLPMIPAFAGVLETLAFDKPTAYATAGLVAAVVPGMFGFLVWELTGNWRLYEANRSNALSPAIIGGHGETMRRFLRWGIHSGTLPKTYARTRRAIRRGDRAALRRCRIELHEVAERLEHFVQRQFAALLREEGFPRFDEIEVRVAAHVVRIAIHDETQPDDPIRITVSERHGWLVAGIEMPPGWTAWPTPLQESFRLALIGLYRWLGVDFVLAQIEARLPPDGLDVEPSREGLVVWRRPNYDAAGVYDLSSGPAVHAYRLFGSIRLPPLGERDLQFSQCEVDWATWQQGWQQPREDTEAVFPALHVLPKPGDDRERDVD